MNISISDLITIGPQYCGPPCAGGHGAGNTKTFTVGNVYIAIVASAGFPPAAVSAIGYGPFTLVSQVVVGGDRYLGVYTYAPAVTHTAAFWFEFSPNGSCFEYAKGYEVS